MKSYFNFQINTFRSIRGGFLLFRTYYPLPRKRKPSTNTREYFFLMQNEFGWCFNSKFLFLHGMFDYNVRGHFCRNSNTSRQSQFINSDIVSARVLNTPATAYQYLTHPITIVFSVEVSYYVEKHKDTHFKYFKFIFHICVNLIMNLGPKYASFYFVLWFSEFYMEFIISTHMCCIEHVWYVSKSLKLHLPM